MLKPFAHPPFKIIQQSSTRFNKIEWMLKQMLKPFARALTVRRVTFDLHEGTDVRTDFRTYARMYVRTVDDVMAIKSNFLAWMGYQYFLSYGAARARAFGACGASLLIILTS